MTEQGMQALDGRETESFSLVSVVVPFFNEAESLDELFRRTRAVFESLGQAFEIILVDDGSTDGSLEVAHNIRRNNDNVTVIQLYSNHGKSLALMEGFDIARGDVAVMMDADLQDLPEMIPRLLDGLRRGNDLVNGWRVHRKDSALKRWVSWLYNVMTDRLLHCRVHDINCGLKAMRRCVYANIHLHGDLHRLIPALATGRGHAVTEVPVEHAPRRHGVSKYRLLRHRGLLDLIAVAASNASRARPFHIFFELGILIIALFGGGGFAAWLTVQLALDPASTSARVLGPIFGVISVWALGTGTMLPVVGFVLDIATARYQDRTWRTGLVRDLRRSGE